jgi:RNA polymerase sigma-70 factor (ECF subfamily)
LWIRGLVGNKLLEVRWFRLGSQMRHPDRDVSLDRGTTPEPFSAALATQLLGHARRPGEAVIHADVKIPRQEASSTMDPIDRELIALRHFQQLTPPASAHVRGIEEKAAGMH